MSPSMLVPAFAERVDERPQVPAASPRHQRSSDWGFDAVDPEDKSAPETTAATSRPRPGAPISTVTTERRVTEQPTQPTKKLSMAIEFSPLAATNFPTGGHFFSPLVATNFPTNRLTGLWCVR
jgi:hypothetical protein